MSLGNTIRNGALWLFIGNSGRRVLGFLLGIILARILAPEHFGMVATVSIFTGLVGFVSGGGMGGALVRAKEANKDDYDVVFTLQLLIGIAIYLGIYNVAPLFAEWYDTPLYGDLLRVSALTFILRPFVNLPSNILHREMRFKAKTMIGVMNLIVGNTIAISMGMMGYGVWSLVIPGLATPFLSIFILWPVSGWRPGLNTDLRRARALVRTGALFSANNIVVYLRQQTSTFILSRTSGAGAVGLYNKADSLATLPHKFVTGSVYDVLFRALSKAQDDLDLSRYLYFRSIMLVAVYSFPLFICLGFLAEPLVVTVYGERWREIAEPISILVLAAPCMIVGNLAGAVLAAQNRLAKELGVQVSLLIVTAIAVYLAHPAGLEGVAIAILITTVLEAGYMHRLAARALRSTLTAALRALVVPAVLALPMMTVMTLARWTLPTEIIADHVTYILVMSAIGVAAYATAFFFAPLAPLRPEVARWRQRITETRRRLLGS